GVTHARGAQGRRARRRGRGGRRRGAGHRHRAGGPGGGVRARRHAHRELIELALGRGAPGDARWMTMSALRVTVTGATGLIGSALLAALRERDAQVTVLSRDPARARARLGADGRTPSEAVRWEPIEEPAPAQALAGRDAVIHLAGENVAQRWTARARRAIRDSRVVGTRHLLAGLREAEPRPGT